MPPIRTLHVDMEGGWGGSSRSLFQLVSRLDRDRVAPLVVHRQTGPVEGWCREIGAPTVHIPEIGSYVPRERAAAKNLIASLPRLRRLGRAADRIAALARAKGVQVVHLNYEGLFLLARALRRRLDVPIVAHSRAHLPESRWGRWLVRSLSRDVDQMLFISPQEAARFEALRGSDAPPGEVMWNIAPPPPPRRPFDDPPRVVFFGSIDRSKGADRMVDVAAALEAVGAPPLRLEIYGKTRTHAGFAEKIAQRIEAENLSRRVRVMGYTDDPMAVMAGALALIRPSRDNDPWGRDVIEAAACGLPALATGRFDGVVRDGETGWLYPSFDADAMARRLTRLVDDPALWARVGDAARERAEILFDGGAQAARFVEIIEELAQSR